MKICSFDGCCKPMHQRGFCNGHYKRLWRHGAPTAGRVPNGTLPDFLNKALSYTGPDCLLWPYGRTFGYGVIQRSGRLERAHRLVCEATHGPSPSPRHEAAHRCGNRACVSPQHLRWATRADNLADRARHGTDQVGERNPAAKLTVSDIREIRSQLHRPDTDLAREFGVVRQTINKIRRGERWAWLNG